MFSYQPCLTPHQRTCGESSSELWCNKTSKLIRPENDNLSLLTDKSWSGSPTVWMHTCWRKKGSCVYEKRRHSSIHDTERTTGLVFFFSFVFSNSFWCLQVIRFDLKSAVWQSFKTSKLKHQKPIRMLCLSLVFSSCWYGSGLEVRSYLVLLPLQGIC